MKNGYALECTDLKVVMGGSVLVQEVSFTLDSKEQLAIIGPNGAGKTTLLKAVLGFIRLSAGGIKLGGVEVRKIPKRELARMVAYVPQLLSEQIGYSVKDFVTMGRYAHEASGEDEVEHCLRVVGMEDFADRVVSTLSGGERQRVCIAAALAQEAPLIIFDEPLAHLDPGQRISIKRLIRQLTERVTVVVVTHDLEWVRRDFKHLLVMRDSRMHFAGESQEFFEADAVDEIFGVGVKAEMDGGADV